MWHWLTSVGVAHLSRWLGHLLGCQILQWHAHARWTGWKRAVGDSLPERRIIHIEQWLGIPNPNCIQRRLLCNAGAWSVPLLAKQHYELESSDGDSNLYEHRSNCSAHPSISVVALQNCNSKSLWVVDREMHARRCFHKIIWMLIIFR